MDWLIESLLLEGDGAPQAEIEAAWDGEIKRRLDEIDSGAVELIAGDEVRAEIVAGLLRGRERGWAFEVAEVPS